MMSTSFALAASIVARSREVVRARVTAPRSRKRTGAKAVAAPWSTRSNGASAGDWNASTFGISPSNTTPHNMRRPPGCENKEGSKFIQNEALRFQIG